MSWWFMDFLSLLHFFVPSLSSSLRPTNARTGVHVVRRTLLLADSCKAMQFSGLLNENMCWKQVPCSIKYWKGITLIIRDKYRRSERHTWVFPIIIVPRHTWQQPNSTLTFQHICCLWLCLVNYCVTQNISTALHRVKCVLRMIYM